MKTSFRFLAPRCAAVALAATLAACGGDDEADTAAVLAWDAYASRAAAEQKLPPPVQAYVLAITQTAVHDAINAIERRYVAYAWPGAASGASVPAAVAAATRRSLLALLPPPAAAAVETEFRAALAAIDAGSARDAGLAAGEAAAEAVLGRRGGDDLQAALTKPYTVPAPGPGVYAVTPPLGVVLAAGLGEVPPFAIASPQAFRSAPPPAPDSAAYAEDYREVRNLGAENDSTRAPEQTETARFWYDASTREWHDAARQGLVQARADAWVSARTLALMSMAMMDAAIASMETKFHYAYWRPITAIRAGEDDGNPHTAGDPAWTPLCVTPPFPEYNSTHAATGAAAARVLSRTIGDLHAFEIRSADGARRSYHRFGAAAMEEGQSRIYCGIHFGSAMRAGLQQGADVADSVVERQLAGVRR